MSDAVYATWLRINLIVCYYYYTCCTTELRRLEYKDYEHTSRVVDRKMNVNRS